MQDSVKLVDFETTLTVDGKIPVLVDTTYQVETFLKYKGRIIDIADLSLKKSKGTIQEADLDREIRQSLRSSIFSGEIVCFFIGGEMDFDLIKFMKEFKWFDKSTFFNYKNLSNKDYLLKQGILKSDEDYDENKNKGFWRISSNFRFCVVYSITDSFLKDVKKQLPSEYFNFHLITD
jgi:hypothetical protein